MKYLILGLLALFPFISFAQVNLEPKSEIITNWFSANGFSIKHLEDYTWQNGQLIYKDTDNFPKDKTLVSSGVVISNLYTEVIYQGKTNKVILESNNILNLTKIQKITYEIKTNITEEISQSKPIYYGFGTNTCFLTTNLNNIYLYINTNK